MLGQRPRTMTVMSWTVCRAGRIGPKFRLLDAIKKRTTREVRTLREHRWHKLTWCHRGSTPYMESQDFPNKTRNWGTWHRSGQKADERERRNMNVHKGERDADMTDMTWQTGKAWINMTSGGIQNETWEKQDTRTHTTYINTDTESKDTGVNVQKHTWISSMNLK